MISIRYNIRSLIVRKATTIATAAGMAMVVFVFAGALMFSAGIRNTLKTSGSNDIAIVMRQGSGNELSSTVESTQVSLINAMPGIKTDSKGPMVSPEAVVVLALPKVGAVGISNVPLRGVTERAFDLRPNLKIVEGRAAAQGSDEVIIGQGIRGRFKGVELGQTFEIRANRNAKVVGVFEAGGSSYESEVWADLEVVRTSFGRGTTVSSVRAHLESPSKFDTFAAAVGQDKRLGLEALRELAYYEKLGEGTSLFFTVLGVLISVCFSVAAMFGAAITMYSAVANRKREIGIMRALGFPRSTILLSFVLESMLLSMAGGVLGVLGALALGSVKLTMLNFSSWSELVFRFELSPEILVGSLVFSLVMGFIGGFFPALRAARTSPLSAIRGG